jgi:hypothetical protein
MTDKVLRAALALAVLHERDRKWIVSQLGTAALSRLQEAEAQLQGENLHELAEQLNAAREGLGGEALQEQALLSRSANIATLLKHEPIWIRKWLLASFSPQGRAALTTSAIKLETSYPTLPSGLRQAILLSIGEAIETTPLSAEDEGAVHPSGVA